MIINDLNCRGLIDNMTPSIENLNVPLITVYAGFDPTADSLHVGHLMALTMLRRFQQHGHRPIVLLGGATGMIGDPSGKSQERNLLSSRIIEKNIARIGPQIQRFLTFTGHNAAVVTNNYEWMGRYSFVDFLRDVGKCFPVNVMLAKDSVQSRLETGLSFTEFSYMLIQAFDFVHLYEYYGCSLQIGGSDQWGNITAGIDLGRRMHGVELHGLTCPLLTKSDGSKMGKTESGTIWLSAEKTSPYDFYNYWLNLDDADVGRCLAYFSDLDQSVIEAVMAQHKECPGKRIAQKLLARELTALVHGL